MFEDQNWDSFQYMIISFEHITQKMPKWVTAETILEFNNLVKKALAQKMAEQLIHMIDLDISVVWDRIKYKARAWIVPPEDLSP